MNEKLEEQQDEKSFVVEGKKDTEEHLPKIPLSHLASPITMPGPVDLVKEKKSSGN